MDNVPCEIRGRLSDVKIETGYFGCRTIYFRSYSS